MIEQYEAGLPGAAKDCKSDVQGSIPSRLSIPLYPNEVPSELRIKVASDIVASRSNEEWVAAVSIYRLLLAERADRIDEREAAKKDRLKVIELGKELAKLRRVSK